MRDVHRVLRPGGQFVIWDTVIPEPPAGAEPVVAVRVVVRIPDGVIRTGYGRRWSGPARNGALYARAAAGAGFEVAESSVSENLIFMRLQRRSA